MHLPPVLLAGCGGGAAEEPARSTTPTSTGGQGQQSAGKAEEQEEAPTDPLSEDQLAAAGLTNGDLEGYQFQEWPVSAQNASTTTPAACRPIHGITLPSKNPAPRAVKATMAIADSDPTGNSGHMIVLLSYTRSDAEELLADLRTALEKCTSFDGGGVTSRTSMKALDAPDAGDEAVAFQYKNTTDPAGVIEVVRQGSTVVLFGSAPYSKNATAAPAEMIASQLAKID